MCFIVFTQAGFVDQYDSLEAFLDARKEDRPLMEEWAAAYDAVVQMGPNMPMRLGKVFADRLSEKLMMARKQRVEAYKKTQKRVATSYTAVLRSKYEKEFPGRIERKGLTCKSIAVDGGRKVDVVLIRKLPKDEWDVTYEDVSGAGHFEEYDAGDFIIRQNQAAAKYQGLANKTVLTKDEVDGVACETDGDSDASIPEKDGGQGDDESIPDSGAEGEDQDLAWVTSCLLDVESGSKAKPKGAATSSRHPAASSSTRTLPTSSPRASKAARSSAQSHCASSPSSSKADGSPEACSAEGDLRRKFRGKSAEDILQPHGYPALRKSLDEILADMDKPCFNSMLSGGSLESYAKEVSELAKRAATLQRGVVGLDIKVKKWKDVPEHVSALLVTERARAKALNDAFAAFAGITKRNDCQKMEVAKAALELASIPIPKAFHVLFFKERGCDLIRFRHLDAFATHVQMDGSGYIVEGMFSKTDSATDLIVDAMADALKMLVQGCVHQEDGTVKNYEAIAELAEKILGCPKGIPESTASDLSLVSAALGDASSCSVSDRNSALATLLSKGDNAGPGILLPMLREPMCRVLLLFQQSRYKSSQPVQETMRL